VRGRRWAVTALLAGFGCAAETEEPPCTVSGDPGLEVAPADVDFGGFVDGDPLYYGVPPQGGALYSPFHARVAGVTDLDEGALVSLTGTDPADGTVIAQTDYELRLVCANVGESAGQWLGTDLHLRFGDWRIDDLVGRAMRLELAVSNLDGDEAIASLEGVLTAMEPAR
jgi:hypothetical protein